ncbi:MAG: restriction endonuclease subunit S [bacterium]|jgi:type I restriction enzyme S subunit
MTEWREQKLSDFMDFNPYTPLSKGIIAKKVTMEKLIPFNRKIQGYEDAVFSGGAKFKNGDTLVARITPCLENGKTAYVDFLDDEEVAFGSTEFIVLRAKEGISDSRFIFYFAISDEFRDTAIQLMSGTSGRQRVDTEALKRKVFTLPPLPEQKAIAEVLSSLDDKIDLLTRQNKTLEDLAQAYFRKWFIEDASSEWEVGKLGDEFNITMGQSPKGETYNDLKIGLPFFQGKAEFGFRFPLEKQYCSEPIKIADKFDTLLSVRAPVGALNMALYKCCIGRGLAIPIHKKGYKHYTFYKMKSLQELFNTFDDDGTVFGSISREKFLSIDNVIPPEKLVCYFDNFAKYFDLKIYENTVQIRTLSKLRDTLLPKLISGEVRVNI